MSEDKMNLSRVLKGVHNQWFSDPDDPEMEFVDPEEEEKNEDPDATIILLGDNEDPPKDNEGEEEDPEKVLLKQQIEDLKTTQANNQSLGVVIGQQIANAVNVQPKVVQQETKDVESQEDFQKRFEDGVFKPGLGLGLMTELVTRIAGPAFQQVVGATVEQSKQILLLDKEKGPTFKKFEAEIEAARSMLPVSQQNDPKVYGQLYDQVVASHPELKEDEIQKRIDDAVSKAMEEAGIEKEPVVPTFTESGGVRRGGGAPKKKKIFIKEVDKDEAKRLGIDIRDYMQQNYGGSR